jgi:hypothetical protein
MKNKEEQRRTKRNKKEQLILILFLLFIPQAIFSQTNPLSLFELKQEAELLLNAEQTQKLDNMRNNKLYKGVQLIHFGNIAQLAKSTNGNIPVKIPGINYAFIAKPLQVEYTNEDNYIWKGQFLKQEGDLKIYCTDGKVYGTIQIEERFFEFQSFEAGKSVLFEYNQEELANTTCASHLISGSEKKVENKSTLKSTSSLANVRALILYTDAAESAVTDIQSTANLAMAQLNEAINNSEISNFWVSLAGIEYLDFTECDTIQMDLLYLINNNDVKALRNSYAADIVVLLTNGNYFIDEYISYAGLTPLGPDNENAYSIVQVGSATSNSFTFAHEVGHQFGARHEMEDDPFGSYEHGYIFTDRLLKRYTIMSLAYGSRGRIQYFSNPDVIYINNPTGTSTHNDVARKLEEEAPIVEAFRFYTPPFSAYIAGPAKGDNLGIYTWSAVVSNGIPPYTYLWKYSLDGYNYNGTLGTTSSITGPLPYDNDLYLKLTVTSSDGQQVIDYHTTINLDAGFKSTEVNSDIDIKQWQEEFERKFSTNNSVYMENEGLEFSIYPNPATEFVTINYFIPEEKFVSIRIYDAQGQLIENLVNAVQYGNKQIELTTSNLPHGVYFCELYVGQEILTQKLIVK